MIGSDFPVFLDKELKKFWEDLQIHQLNLPSLRSYSHSQGNGALSESIQALFSLNLQIIFTEKLYLYRVVIFQIYQQVN